MLQLLWIILALGAVWLAVAFSTWIPYTVGGLLVVGVVGWILASVLSPSMPDRTCPGCGEKGLVKICRGKPGVRCERCSFRDENMHVAYLDDW
jgi:DNA-directed RNA polymerase subunit RPC12/RpoP